MAGRCVTTSPGSKNNPSCFYALLCHSKYIVRDSDVIAGLNYEMIMVEEEFISRRGREYFGKSREVHFHLFK